MELNVLSPLEALYWANQSVLQAGRPRHSRGRDTLEIQHMTIHVKYPHINPLTLGGRDARPTIGALEACQLVGQITDPDGVVRRVKAMEPYADGGMFWGAYGARVAGQLSRAEALLATDLGTRQAVVTIYDGQRDLMASVDGVARVHDIPCTLTLQFMWDDTWPRDTRLGLRVSMRSNDVHLGLPYDLFQFTSLQMAMADALGVTPGWYVHTVGSMHAYHDDLEKVQALTAPSEPVADELPYVAHWGDGSMAEISGRARAILAGRPIEGITEYEAYLIEALKERP